MYKTNTTKYTLTLRKELQHTYNELNQIHTFWKQKENKGKKKDKINKSKIAT